MANKESEMWARIREPLRLAGFDPVRVENPVHPGTPDVNITTGWIELKQADGWPTRQTTPLRLAHFTQQQRVWLIRRRMVAGLAWVLLRVGKDANTEWMIFGGEIAAKLLGTDRGTRMALCGACLARWTPNLIDRELVTVLRH